MITTKMSNENDISKIIWCIEMFGDDFSFKEPMQFTFKNKNQLLLYYIRWGT